MSSISPLLRRAFSSSALSNVSRVIYKESDLRKVVENFKKFTENDTFRNKVPFYEHTIQRLANAKRFEWIEEILEEQKKYKDIRREGFAVRLISLYGKSGMIDHAYKVFDEMPQLNCDRTVKSFNALLGACVNSKNFDKVDGFFRELPGKLSIKPDIYSYNTVIKAFCEMGSLDSAISLLDEMEKEELKPDLITFNILLDALYKKERFLDGEKMWNLMGKYDITPDIISYNMKLYGLVSEKKIQEAIGLVKEIKTKRLKLDVFTYNTLFKGICNDVNYLEEAKRWYNEMVKTKCTPNRLTLVTLLTLACEKRHYYFASRLCRMLFHLQLELNEENLVQTVVDGLTAKGNMKEAELLVKLGKETKCTCYHELKMPKLVKEVATTVN